VSAVAASTAGQIATSAYMMATPSTTIRKPSDTTPNNGIVPRRS
jgi:hypothetical protein